MSLGSVLITGGGGQLASDLVALLGDGTAAVSAPAHAELDVTDNTAVERALAAAEPDVLFNCAAFHNVEVCEREEDRSFEVNARAVKRLAERCAERDVKLVHLSTNYVFDGAAPEPYGEHDAPSPRSIYALSKLAGEYAASAYAPGALVVRSAGLYGLHGSESKGGNFVTRMTARAREQGSLRMVADQRLSPTSTADLARSLVAAVETGATGVLHLTSSEDCSWLEFTEAIMALAHIDVAIEGVPTVRVQGAPIAPSTACSPAPRRMPPVSRRFPHWRDALGAYMERAGLAGARR